MRRSSLPKGQLSLFDLYNTGTDSEVQMISLDPDDRQDELIATQVAAEENTKVKLRAGDFSNEVTVGVETELDGEVTSETELDGEVTSETTSEMMEEVEVLDLNVEDDVKIYSVKKASNRREGAEIVMHHELLDDDGNVIGEISYLNYSKVYIKRGNEEGILRSFDSSKEAVDFYIDEMLKMQ